MDRFEEDESFETHWNAAKAGNRVGRGTGKRDTGLPPMAVMLDA